MEFYQVIEQRRTVRDFADTAVESDKIRRVLTAGLKAPTYNHLRDWNFVLVNDPTIRLAVVQAEGLPEQIALDELQRTFAHHDPAAKEMYLDAIPKQKRMLLTAPELLIIAYRPKTQIADSQRIYDLNGFASVWCCIENILLAMAAENLFGVTFIPQHTSELKTVLGVPEEWEIATLIPFGYRAMKARILPQKDVELQDKLHFDRWRVSRGWDYEEEPGFTFMQLL